MRNKNYNNENNSNANSNNKVQKRHKYFNFERYSNSFRTLIDNEAKKPEDERSRDKKAIILTVIIVGILVFIAWKIPAVHDFLFP